LRGDRTVEVAAVVIVLVEREVPLRIPYGLARAVVVRDGGLVLEGGRGAFTTTIPAGSFRARRDGRLTFEGRIDGVALEIRISPVSSTQFRFQAEGTAAYLSGIANPVVVTLTLGDDSGTTSVTAQMQ